MQLDVIKKTKHCKLVYKYQLQNMDEPMARKKILMWLEKKYAKDITAEGGCIYFRSRYLYGNRSIFHSISKGKILLRQKEDGLQIYLIIYPKVFYLIFSLIALCLFLSFNPILVIILLPMIPIFYGIIKDIPRRFGNYITYIDKNNEA